MTIWYNLLFYQLLFGIVMDWLLLWQTWQEYNILYSNIVYSDTPHWRTIWKPHEIQTRFLENAAESQDEEPMSSPWGTMQRFNHRGMEKGVRTHTEFTWVLLHGSVLHCLGSRGCSIAGCDPRRSAGGRRCRNPRSTPRSSSSPEQCRRWACPAKQQLSSSTHTHTHTLEENVSS